MNTNPIIGQEPRVPPVVSEAAKCRRDFRGFALCEACWNGLHCHRAIGATGKPTTKIIVDCLGGDCECPCRELVAQTKKPTMKRPPAKVSKPLVAREDEAQFDLFKEEVPQAVKAA